MTNFQQLISEMRSKDKGMTFQKIADATGMTRGAVHDLMNHPCKTVMYDTGVKLVHLHRSVMRQKSK